MRNDYPQWLIDQTALITSTQNQQIHRVQKVEESYGDLEEHFKNNTYDSVITNLQYSTQDERENKPNPSKITIKGSFRKGLQSYKNAIVLYKKFLNDNDFESTALKAHKPSEEYDDVTSTEESNKQKLSLERDMQAALRNNIESLEPNLKIIDDGAEYSVNSGLIDITCEDNDSLVVIELKAGKADSRAIGQILGYMGDLYEEEGEKPVRGILVAHDFDKRVKSAARIVPNLKLVKYDIQFNFTEEE